MRNSSRALQGNTGIENKGAAVWLSGTEGEVKENCYGWQCCGLFNRRGVSVEWAAISFLWCSQLGSASLYCIWIVSYVSYYSCGSFLSLLPIDLLSLSLLLHILELM